MPETETKKRLIDRTGGELRERASASREPDRTWARGELERRRECLRGAVIPGWERAARGEDPADWKLW